MRFIKPHSSRQPTPAISAAKEIKPLLRGWSHALASVGAVGVTIALLWQTYHDPVRFVSVLVFGVSMIMLYSVSSLYHIGNWDERRLQRLRSFDHANIFVLIAGTYTPICVNVLTGRLGMLVLVLVWAIAGVGIGCVALALRLPRWMMASFYLGMGWIGMVSLPALIEAFPLPAVLLLLAGGVLYSIGAIIYVLRRPNPLPRVFGFHEIFHLFVIGGSVAFIVVIWLWVVPYAAT